MSAEWWQRLPVSVDQCALLVCLVGSFGVSEVYWRWLLPVRGRRDVKLAFIAGWGVVFSAALVVAGNLRTDGREPWWDWWPWVHILTPALCTYLLAKHFTERPWMPKLVFFGLLAHITLLHYYRFVHSYGQYTVDFVQIVMINVMRLSSFACDLHDSWALKHPANRASSSSSSSNSTSMVVEEKRRRRLEGVRFPGPLEFAAYVFFYAGVLAGPLVCFPELQRFLDGTFFLVDRDSSAEAAILPKEALRARSRRVRLLCLQVVVFLAYFFWARSYFSYDFLSSTAFGKMPWLARFVYLHFFSVFFRSRYYVAWGLAEASCVLLGIGFNGLHHHHHDHNEKKIHHDDAHHDDKKAHQDKKSLKKDNPHHHHRGENAVKKVEYRWDRLEMVNPVKIELSWNFRDALGMWHRPTHDWLYEYVYMRFGARRGDGKLGFRANLLTKLTSAWWHGVYPGYYFVFVTAALFTWATKVVYKAWPFRWKYQRVLGGVAHHLAMDYFVLTFDLVSWRACLAFLQNQLFWGHIAMLAVILGARLVRTRGPIVV